MKILSCIFLFFAFVFVPATTVARPLDQSARSPKIQALNLDPLPSRVVDGVQNTAANQGTTYFGGTFWNADSSRWEAIQDSVWTFDSGVGSHFDHGAPYVNPFKDPALHAYMEGWVGIDNSYSEIPYFRRLSASDFAGGTVCVGATAGLGGSYSFWAGVLPGETDSLCYADGQGYGNNWFVCIEQEFGYVSGSVTLEYDFVNDTEPGFDFSYVFVDTTGNDDDAEVVVYGGITSGHAVHNLTQGTHLPVTSTGSVTIKFCTASDGAYSDEDGLYTTNCGAFAVDDIAVSGALTHSADFETGSDGWALSSFQPGRGGDWSNLVDLTDLPPIPLPPCPCTLQSSVLLFEDLTVGGHGMFQDNMAASPWIDLKAAGRQTPGKFIQTDAYYDLPLQNYVFIQTQIQWYPKICPNTGTKNVSPWTSDGFIQFPLLSPGCTRETGNPMRFNFGPVVDENAERVRIAIGVISYCGFYNCSGTGNSTPWFDNVRFGVFGAQDAPTIATSSIDVPQDAFPEDGTLGVSSPGRLDGNNVKGDSSPEPFTSLADTLIVQGGANNMEVWVEFAVRPGPGINPAALASWLAKFDPTGTRQGLNWYAARMDTAEQAGIVTPGTWMTAFHEEAPGFTGSDTDLDPNDLTPTGSVRRLANDIFPDDLFTPGTRLNLFYKARFVGGTSWFTDPDTALGTPFDGDRYHEFEVLPSSMDADSTFNCVLYVDHFSERGAKPIIEEALSTILPGSSANYESTAWDRWDVQAPSSQQASFGRPLNTEYGATVVQALGYNTILWNSGNLGAFTLVKEDADVLIPWLELGGFGESNLYLSGDGIAASMTLEQAAEPSATTLLEDYLGVFYTCNTYRNDNCPPGAVEDTTSCINLDPVAGSALSTRPLGGIHLGQGNGCPNLRSFDVIGMNTSPIHGIPKAEETYSSAISGAQFASVSNAATGNVAYKSVVDGLSVHYRRNPGDCNVETASPPLAVEERLREVLSWFDATGSQTCQDLSGTIGIPPGPGTTPRAPVLRITPNPMRGVSGTILFALPTEGPARIQVFDLRGRLVRTVFDGLAAEGENTASWDGDDDAGRLVAAGVYFLRLTTPLDTVTRRAIRVP